MKRTVVAAAIGECVHVAGVMNFLRLAEASGWRTVFLGPATPISALLEAAKRENAQMVGVSYRLTPETGERLLAEFAEEADDLRAAGVKFYFAGTPPLARRARVMGFFDAVFDGSEEVEEVISSLKEDTAAEGEPLRYPQTTMERIEWKAPYPLLRHHFGLPTMKDSLEGVREIAEGKDYTDHVNAEIRSARQLGIQGVPFFIFDGKLAVSGAQPAEVFTQALSQVTQMD